MNGLFSGLQRMNSLLTQLTTIGSYAIIVLRSKGDTTKKEMEKMKNKQEIKAILEMEITDGEKRNLIANIKNVKADLGRLIRTDQELEIKVGQEWNNLNQATSWTNRDKENEGFKPENDGEIEYMLQFENGKVEGYEEIGRAHV